MVRYYKGEYKWGAKHGYGVFVYRDETRFEGTFTNNVKEGQGIMYYSDGSKYVGDYHFGMMDGQGEYVWPNGVKYIGEWRADERHGFGQMYFSLIVFLKKEVLFLHFKTLISSGPNFFGSSIFTTIFFDFAVILSNPIKIICSG